MHATQVIAAATLVIATTALAWAGPKHHGDAPSAYYDYARVVSSTPVYEEINTPRQECWTEQVSHEVPRNRSYGGAILGGIVGGILGNQIGGGTGKTVATAVGAATGAIVGDSMDSQAHAGSSQTRVEAVQRCRSVDDWSRRIVGYDVVYRHDGRHYSTFLPYDPGQKLRVKVNLSVAERW
jgi:uncharacterized protein YcfJ